MLDVHVSYGAIIIGKYSHTIINNHSCLKYFIFTKLSQTVRLIETHKLQVCQYLVNGIPYFTVTSDMSVYQNVGVD